MEILLFYIGTLLPRMRMLKLVNWLEAHPLNEGVQVWNHVEL